MAARQAAAILLLLTVIIGLPVAIALLQPRPLEPARPYSAADAEDLVAGCIRLTRIAAQDRP